MTGGNRGLMLLIAALLVSAATPLAAKKDKETPPSQG